MQDKKVMMICMQQGMAVSKAGTEALAAAVTVNQCIYTGRDWLEDVAGEERRPGGFLGVGERCEIG
jgi:hypothetical protein